MCTELRIHAFILVSLVYGYTDTGCLFYSRCCMKFLSYIKMKLDSILKDLYNLIAEVGFTLDYCYFVFQQHELDTTWL